MKGLPFIKIQYKYQGASINSKFTVKLSKFRVLNDSCA